MVVLIDTNIIVDFLVKREPYAEEAIKIVELCNKKCVKGYLAAHTISNLFYILRKEFSVSQRREVLKALCGVFEISEIDRRKIQASLENYEFADFEDCLQMECALDVGAEYIVTRNPADFIHSKVPVIEPGDFLRMIMK